MSSDPAIPVDTASADAPTRTATDGGAASEGAKKGKWGNLLTRVLTAGALAVLALVPLWLGGWWWKLFLLVAGIRIAFEWLRMIGVRDTALPLALYTAAIALTLLIVTVSPAEFVLLLVLAVIVAVPAIYRLTMAGPGARLRRIVTGAAYIIAPLAAAAWLRGAGAGFDDPGFQRVAFVLLVVIAADAGAYFAGKTIGGPKFIPALSPNKTWAGFAGGLVIGALLGGVLAEWLSDDFFEGVVVGAVLVVAAVAGDFLESGFKRRFGVKDTGTIFPGHGGVLDRFDSHMAALTVAALVIGLAPGLSPV